MPSRKTIRSIFCLAGMPVVPFLAGNFGTNIICHNGTIVSEVANRKAIGFEAASSGTEDDSFCFEKPYSFFIHTEACCPCNSTILFNEMRDHYPFDNRNIPTGNGGS